MVLFGWLAQLEGDSGAVFPVSAPDTAMAVSGVGRGDPLYRILELYDRLHEPVYRYLLCLRLTPQEAEDITHETFLRAHKHLQERRSDDQNIRAWTFRVAHNLAISLKRRTAEVQVDSDTLISLADAREGDEYANPEQAVLKEEWIRNVQRTVGSLPELQQRCLHLRAEGLRYREIAKVLGTPVPTVAAHLQRAMARLMEECGD